ncbi:MAG: hypothetical protein LAP85_25270 [Acidobacteriia bacterium]|nr:hypothetical protein [Terriglobia bacterium]
MGAASYKYYLDIHGDGNLVDVTEYVYRAQWRYGRDLGSQLTGRSTAGTCTLSVRNKTSYFSKYNPASPFFGKTLPGMLMRVTMSVNGNAERVMFQGDLDSITPEPGDHINGATASIRGVGILTRLSECLVTVPMHQGIATGAAMTAVLDAANFPAGDRLLDTGRSTISRWWTQSKVPAFQAARDLEENEAGFVRESHDGKFVFEDRGHRAGHVPAVTWTDQNVPGAVRYSQITMADNARDVYNVIESRLNTFNISEEQVIWTYVDLSNNKGGDALALAPGETRKITAEFTPSGQNIGVDEWGMIDYQAYANSDGSGTELTEGVDIVPPDKTGMTMDLEITNNNLVTAYVTLLRAHGTMVVAGDGATVRARENAKVDRTYPFPGRYLTNVQEAQDFCDHLLALYKNVRPIVTITLRGHRSVENLLEAQAREISDKIHVEAGEKVGLFVDEDFFVESIQHDVDAVAGTHMMTIECSEDVSDDWPDSVYPYDPKTIPPPPTGGEPHVPDEPWTNSIVNGMNVLVGCLMKKWNADITEAEFRAKCFLNGEKPETADLRTPAEGGTLVHDGIASLVITGLKASYAGRNYAMKGLASGRWYYAWRFKNAAGFSVWSDGNDVPRYVRDYAETGDEARADIGPPAKWTGSVAPGPLPNTVVVSVSRPEENGNVILFVFFQVKDASSAGWNPFDDEVSSDEGECHVAFDGSGTAHRFNPTTGVLEKDTSGWGDAVEGDLLLLDVRGKGTSESGASPWALFGKIESNKAQLHLNNINAGTDILQISQHGVSESIYSDSYVAAMRKSAGNALWDLQHCMWGTIPALQGNQIPGLFGFRCLEEPGPDGWYQDVRVKIVHGPWSWNRHGYFGALPTHGWSIINSWKVDGGDKKTQTFISDPIPVPGDVPIEHMQARIVFGNGYSFSDDDYHTDFSPADTQPGGTIPVKDGPVLQIDAKLGCVFSILLTQDCSLSAPAGATHGQPILVIVTQDDVGGHHLTLGAGFNVGDVEYEIALGAGKRSYLGLIYNGDEEVFDLVPSLKGY